MILADIDEFFSYPCDMEARLREHDIWCSMMVDMLAPSGRVESIQPDISLAEQFPVPCYLRSHLRESVRCNKIALMAIRMQKHDRRLRIFMNNHETDGEWADQRCRPLPSISGGGAGGATLKDKLPKGPFTYDVHNNFGILRP